MRIKQIGMFSASTFRTRQAGSQEILFPRLGNTGAGRSEPGTRGGQQEPGEWHPGETDFSILMPCLRTVLRSGSLGREAVHGQVTLPLDSACLRHLLHLLFLRLSEGLLSWFLENSSCLSLHLLLPPVTNDHFSSPSPTATPDLVTQLLLKGSVA